MKLKDLQSMAIRAIQQIRSGDFSDEEKLDALDEIGSEVDVSIDVIKEEGEVSDVE